jgi:hypothetical protein
VRGTVRRAACAEAPIDTIVRHHPIVGFMFVWRARRAGRAESRLSESRNPCVLAAMPYNRSHPLFAHHAALSRGAPPHSYPNFTIQGVGFTAVVYTPNPLHGYYRSSRYDWGSMVGRIALEVPNSKRKVTLCVETRPRPHKPLVSDHAIGMGAEFGCGVRGALCKDHNNNMLTANGVFGYGDAGVGGTFLKLGVGKLLRPLKLRTDGYGYNFTHSYKFAEKPQWKLTPLENSSGIIMEQRVSHKRWGWAMRRKIYSCGKPERRPTLCVDLTLTNTGQTDIRTPYASGNAFNLAAGPPTGKHFAVTFSVPGSQAHFDHGYNNRSWSVPLTSVADVSLRDGAGQSRVNLKRLLTESEHASVNFNVTNSGWDGKYSVHMPAAPGWNVIVRHSMWRDASVKRSGWYGFNLRVSRRALAPRPFLLLDLKPGETLDLSHRYEFDWKPANH